jgi:hypothetical protein
MHRFTNLLMLGAAVSAIDIRFTNWGCTGSYIACNDIGPGICCHVDELVWSSIAWNAIPRGWAIMGQAHWQSDCGDWELAVSNNANGDICYSES